MRIRSGDLAISIHTKQPHNNGLIVQVMRPFAKTEEWPMEETAWWCTCEQLMTWGIGKRIVQAHAGPVPEACLFPIRGAQGDIHESRAKRPSRKTRPSLPSVVSVTGSLANVIKTLPQTAPANEREMADGVPV